MSPHGTGLRALLLLGFHVLLSARSVAASCDVTKNEEFSQCFGALGQPVFIDLINDTTGYEISLKNSQNERIFNFKYGSTTYYACCLVFFNNGTLRMDKGKKNYSSKYNLEIHDLDGTFLQSRKIQLAIEKPVSSPVLSTLCLSHGKLKVSCSTEGDNPQYTWSLGDGPLEGYDGKGAVVLGMDVSGDVTCTVWNNVSRESSTLRLPTCTETGASMNCTLVNGVMTNSTKDSCGLVSVAVGATFALSVLLIIMYYHYKKKAQS
ncbi:uncharacterized protein LOC108923052 [Scleropages formosus]|uniref:uncharacterized protein LOC108923052 n=1 Tax=Scleropages formosus TaxID=113540 RepID=UPI000878CA65|nr:uncharacterized protein LOC108923052 [Scleropages formosus]